jgi:hypothetical protein
MVRAAKRGGRMGCVITFLRRGTDFLKGNVSPAILRAENRTNAAAKGRANDCADKAGKFLIREMMALVKGQGSGWIKYRRSDPLTKKIEEKSSYIEKMGGCFVGAGIFEH